MQESPQNLSPGSKLDPKVGANDDDQEAGDCCAPALGQSNGSTTHSRSTGLSSTTVGTVSHQQAPQQDVDGQVRDQTAVRDSADKVAPT